MLLLLLSSFPPTSSSSINTIMIIEPWELVTPSVGFQASDIVYHGCRVKMFDLGGGPRIRGIWAKYYAEVCMYVSTYIQLSPMNIAINGNALKIHNNYPPLTHPPTLPRGRCMASCMSWMHRIGICWVMPEKCSCRLPHTPTSRESLS